MTKIVATIGPASMDYAVIKKLLLAGVNCVRINASHGDHQQYQRIIDNVRKADKETKRFTTIQLDNQGPKLRIGTLPDAGIRLNNGERFSLEYNVTFDADRRIIPTQYDLSKVVSPGEIVFLRDGRIKARVLKIENSRIDLSVEVGDFLFSKQGINLPDSDFKGDILNQKDLEDINFAMTTSINQIALSFVQRAKDVEQVRNILEKNGKNIKIVTKIETKNAIKNIEEIVKASDGILIARGDLAYETAPEEVPVYQFKIIKLCRKYRKFVIVATQMLESMTESLQPTRAEVSDVAGAVIDQADAVMLSGETASGKYPVETVQMMKRIILNTESANIPYRLEIDNSFGASVKELSTAYAASELAKKLQAKAIISETITGRTARYISNLRVDVPQIITSPKAEVLQNSSILWGAKVIKSSRFGDGLEEAIAFLKKTNFVKKGDWIVRVYAKHRKSIGAIDSIYAMQIT